MVGVALHERPAERVEQHDRDALVLGVSAAIRAGSSAKPVIRGGGPRTSRTRPAGPGPVGHHRGHGPLDRRHREDSSAGFIRAGRLASSTVAARRSPGRLAGSAKPSRVSAEPRGVWTWRSMP